MHGTNSKLGALGNESIFISFHCCVVLNIFDVIISCLKVLQATRETLLTKQLETSQPLSVLTTMELHR